MNFDSFKRFPISGFGGQVDYQGPTRVVAGSAQLARNMSFDKRRARTRDGLVDTIFKQKINGSPVTGYDVLEVVGDTNPGEYPIFFTEDGKLYLEAPCGSGCAVELQTPFPLPANARMQTAAAFNCLYMAFSDGIRGLCPPLRYNGLTGVVGPVSQNPIGARWVVGRFAQVGDVITDSNQHWWRCTTPGFMGDEPPFSGQTGYFDGDTFIAAVATSHGGTKWEEWTPGFEIYLPTPDVSLAFLQQNTVPGTISGGKDLYVRIAYVNEETGEGPWSDPKIFFNTVANTSISLYFGLAPNVGGPPIPRTGGPFMPRWLAELNLKPDKFFPFQMNVYGAVVNHGSPAPTQYFLVGTTPATTPAFIGVDPVTNSDNTNFSRPSAVVSPNPTFAGTLAFSNPTYANDGSTSTAAQGKGTSIEHLVRDPEGGDPTPVDSNTSSSAIWSGFVAPPDLGQTIYLFIDYSASFTGSVNQVSVTIQYTIDNGANWLLVDSFTASRARAVFKVAMAGGQDYTHIKVRAQVVGAGPDGQGSRTGTLSIYDIRAGVAVLSNASAIGAIILRQTAAGIDLTGPPIFTGETGLRYAVLIRRDDTDSPSPVDSASPVPIIFTNGEIQRVAILPPGGPTTKELIVALAEAGAQQAGPFFDIVASDPVNPASSSIIKITRDGAGLASATVKNAIGFQAGHQILVAGVGSGFDGSFAISAVDPSINQIQWGQDGVLAEVDNLGTVTEQQNNLRTGVDAPDNFFYLNFNDDFLSKSRDDTNLLILGPAPNASDVSFLPTLKKMAYVDDLGAFHFSQDDDPGNIDQAGGILLVEASKGGRGLGVREMTHGQIMAIKSNGAYQLNTSDITPSNWNPDRLWELHGPPCAQMIAVGKDFFVFGCKEGAYFFAGADNAWLSQELQGDEHRGSWNDIDWTFGHRFWCADDPDGKVIHFGVCTDGRGFPNEVFTMSYVSGWTFPEVRTRAGTLITSDESRKWSRWPVAARIGKYIKRTLIAAIECPGDPYTVTQAFRSGGKVTLQFPIGAAPTAGVGDRIRVTVPSDPSFNGDVAVSDFDFSPVPELSYDQAGLPDAPGGVGTTALLTKVEDQSGNKPMVTHQMTYAVSDLAKWKDYQLKNISRVNGVVRAYVIAPWIIGDGTRVVVSDAGTFNGEFPTGVGAAEQPDGTWLFTWNQADVDETVFSGTLSTTMGAVRIAAFQPGRLDDNEDGIDCQYLPSYTQTEQGTVQRVGGIRGSVRGSGKLLVRMVTEDPAQQFEDQEVELKANRAVTQFALAASNGDPLDAEFIAPLFSNGAVPGSGFELIEVGVYANPWLSGSDT